MYPNFLKELLAKSQLAWQHCVCNKNKNKFIDWKVENFQEKFELIIRNGLSQTVFLGLICESFR